MKIRRTDLALEARELWQESAGRTTRLKGVQAHEGERLGVPVTVVRVLDEAGAAALGKPVGTYVTVESDGLADRAEGIFRRLTEAAAEELRGLLPPMEGGDTVLVVGLGNRAMTPDSVGPLAHRNLLVTRHLVTGMPEQFSGFRPVASLAAEVLASTGVESGELAAAVCEKIRPACVIAVDALASRSVRRLCRTIQLSDTGIVPGSGVGNHRRGLTRESLGVPVLALGVPTVVDGATLAADLTGRETQEGRDLFVTPRDIDSRVADLGRLLGWAITLALQPGLDWEDLELLLG